MPQGRFFYYLPEAAWCGNSRYVLACLKRQLQLGYPNSARVSNLKTSVKLCLILVFLSASSRVRLTLGEHMEKKESSSLTRKVSSKSATTRLIRRPELLRMTGLANSTLYAYMAQGRFPRPVKIGARSVAWPEEAILDWIVSRPTAELREEAAG